MSKEIVLAGACRTAIGKMGGSLTGVPAAQLGAIVIKEALNRAGVKPEQVDEVFMGCVLQAAQGQNVARQAALKAGLPIEVPAQTLNIVALRPQVRQPRGRDDRFWRGGHHRRRRHGEHVRDPLRARQARYGYRMNDGKLIDCMIKDSLWDAFNNYHMGITAENVAEKYGITREMQDEFAASSQQKCEAARKAGRFKDEIVPVPIKVKKETVLFDTDEFPRDGVTAEGIAKLRPAFKEGGTVTAANASGINDGAAAIVVMSADQGQGARHQADGQMGRRRDRGRRSLHHGHRTRLLHQEAV